MFPRGVQTPITTTSVTRAEKLPPTCGRSVNEMVSATKRVPAVPAGTSRTSREGVQGSLRGSFPLFGAGLGLVLGFQDVFDGDDLQHVSGWNPTCAGGERITIWGYVDNFLYFD